MARLWHRERERRVVTMETREGCAFAGNDGRWIERAYLKLRMFFPSFNFFLKRKSLLASRQTARSSRPGCRTLRRSIPGRTSTLMMSDSAGRVLFFENDGGKRLGKYPHESLHCTRFARTLLKSPCLSHSFFDARAFSAVVWCLGRVIGFEMRRENFFSCLGRLCVATQDIC